MYQWSFGHILFPLYESGLRRRHTLKYLRRLEEQQWLSPGEIREIQWEKLMALLRHAELRVPFYAERMRKAGLASRAINSPDDFARLPALTKQDIRENQQALVAEGAAARSLHSSATGGSTGEPLRFQYDHESYEWRVAAAARADRWAGWDWGCRQFYIWGAALQPQRRMEKLKKRLHNRLLNMQIVSSFDFSESVLADYVGRLNRFRPDVVVGYTNAVYEFARFCREKDLRVWRPRGVIVSAERLFGYQRETIAGVFQTDVFDRYGCRETMNVAAECGFHQGLHINADNLYLELENGGVAAESGTLGEVLLTDLNNYAMPFIRYRNGDLAVAAPAPCLCGRGLPVLERVEGRVLDVIVTPDGRRLPGEFFPHMLKDYPGIDRYQVYQDASYAVTLRIVPGRGFREAQVGAIEEMTRQRIGPSLDLKVQLVDSIPRTEGGKLRVTISEVKARPGLGARASRPGGEEKKMKVT